MLFDLTSLYSAGYNTDVILKLRMEGGKIWNMLFGIYPSSKLMQNIISQ
jgi:hypothetical protein